jgi:peptidoglycan/xylan/chitin deacetylase (PgdA/CDA1 family)
LLYFRRNSEEAGELEMRVIIACAVVLVSVVAAIALARMNVLAPPPPVAAALSAQPAAPAPKAASVAPAPANRAPVIASDATSSSQANPMAPVAQANLATAPTPASVAMPDSTVTAAATTAKPSPAPAPAIAQAAPAPSAATHPPAAAPQTASCPGNPNALGVARTVQIDTTGGPGFGFEHFKSHDFLRPGEVVLTFDDGPWQNNTPKVLAELARHCTKAIFFPIGKHATYYPEILRQVAAAGHSIGSHTWSHQDLSKIKNPEEAKAEIEKGVSAVHWALETAPMAPFFRFPALRHPPEMVTYLGDRNVAIFSTDMDSFDFKMRKPEQVVNSVLEKLKKHGKGIVLMHDFQHATAEGIGTLLDQLKANGYKVVHMTGKTPLQSLPQYDEMIIKDQKLPTVSTRPTSDVVKTINE